MDFVLTKASSGSSYLPKPNSRTASDSLIHLLIQNFEHNFSYSELLQFVKCHWKDLNQKDGLSISADKKSLFFTESSQKAIVILVIKANDLQDFNEVTCEQFEAVLKDLTHEDKKSLALTNSLGENDKNKINDILKNPHDCKDYFQKGIDSIFTSKLFLNSVDNDQAGCIIPFDLTPTINSNLNNKDALSFSSTCKKLYLNLNLMLEMHTWKIHRWEVKETINKLKIADELISRTNKQLPDLRLPLEHFVDKNGNVNKAKFFEHLMEYIVDLYLHLRKNPESVNDRDQFGRTLLHHAAAAGFMKNSRLLLTLPGGNVNLQDADGNTPLHLLIGRHSLPIEHKQFLVNLVNEAIGHGFDPSIKNRLGETILHLAAQHAAGFVSLILNTLIKNNVPNLGSILDTLANEKAMPHSTNLSTALHICISQRSWGDVLELLNAGANLDLCDNRLDVLNTIEKRIRVLQKLKKIEPINDYTKRYGGQLERCQELQSKLNEIPLQGELNETSNCIIS